MRSSKLLAAGTLLAMAAALIGCGVREQVSASKPEPAYFPASDVCSYPHAGPGKLFVNLGGGSWARSDPAEPASLWECVGSTPQVQFDFSENALIRIGYGATGTESGASLVSLEYAAKGRGPIPNESTYRNAFSNLTNAIVQKALGQPVPDLFKRKISNLSSYTRSGITADENFDIGSGFVLLTRESVDGTTDIKVTVRIFPDTVLKLK